MNLCDSRIRLWYLSGGMTKFGADNFDESNNWRVDIKEQIEKISEGYITAFNPNSHFSMMDDPNEFTDREAMNLDIYKLRQSELVIYANNDPLSRGSMIEIGIATERRIPIIVLNENKQELHPWVESLSERVFEDRKDLMLYLQEHYIRND